IEIDGSCAANGDLCRRQTALPCHSGWLADVRAFASALEHDPEKWVPVFGKDHAPAPPPVVVAQADRSPPGNNALDDIEGNSRGITRQEVEAALIDWCATH